tara:strand:- start:75 stop:305 length:231 start_codon:yes stop_codon:yes gene_type:complete
MKGTQYSCLPDVVMFENSGISISVKKTDISIVSNKAGNSLKLYSAIHIKNPNLEVTIKDIDINKFSKASSIKVNHI